MPQVMIAPSHVRNEKGEFLDILINAGLEPVYPKRNAQMTEAELLEQMPGITYSLSGSEPYNRKVMDACPDLKVIARAGVGYDNVDVAYATEKGITVAFAPGSNQEAVAEHAMLMILALAKSLQLQDREIREGKWPRRAYLPVRGTTVAIIGLGRTGKAVATRAKAFGMKVLAVEPVPDIKFIAEHGIDLVPMEQAIREADWITLHVPLTPETHFLINSKTIGWMKPTAHLINSSRGPVVNEAELAVALQAKRIAGAAIDVFMHEPPGKDHPLVPLDNVILSAHTAGVDVRSRDNMVLFAAEAIVDLHLGRWPEERIVNPEVRKGS
jgi:D-3-phosphoglycerate dehydrogenase / 2-oxoglutarate reductase